MKLTKRKLRQIIREAYNSASDAGLAQANAVKRQFLKLYDADVQIDGRNGWVVVNGKKAVNISSASGRPRTEDEMISQMEDAMWAGGKDEDEARMHLGHREDY